MPSLSLYGCILCTNGYKQSLIFDLSAIVGREAINICAVPTILKILVDDIKQSARAEQNRLF
jgi:hypothetical protein